MYLSPDCLTLRCDARRNTLPLLRGASRPDDGRLGKSPLCESFLPADRLETMETLLSAAREGLHALLARTLPSFVPPDEIFHEYAYFSAYSDSWVEHAGPMST